MSRAERAKAYFLEGYACSQAVALAFCDIMGVDEQTVAKLMLPFGGGLGRLRLTCGAVSGMGAVVGAVFSESENTSENKKKTYAIVQEICEKFKCRHGSLLCGELLAEMNTPVAVGGVAEVSNAEYNKKRSCADIVYSATEIMEEYLKEKGIIQE